VSQFEKEKDRVICLFYFWYFMGKKANEFKMIVDLADYYRNLSDEELLKISHGYSPNWDIKYKKALNVVLKERGLKISN